MERTWAHPSEFDRFAALPEPVATRPRHYTPLLLSVATLGLVLGCTVLVRTGNHPAPSLALSSHVARDSVDLPAPIRQTAGRVLTIATDHDGHVQTAAAIVTGNGSLAVTTLTLQRNALLSASTFGGRHVTVQVQGADATLGLTFLSVEPIVPVTPIGALPASISVLAMMPTMTGGMVPSIYWTTTAFGDPFVLSTSRTSTLAVKPAADLDGATGAVALDAHGAVVAILSSSKNWLPARYVAAVARAYHAAPFCRGRLGITATSASGGGVLILAVEPGTGLRPGDTLTALDGTPVADLESLTAVLYATPGRRTATVTIVRGAVVQRAVVSLGCGS